MPVAYVPVPTILPATVNLPVDLVDQRTAASVNVPHKAAIDAIAYLGESVTARRGMHMCSPIGHDNAGMQAKTYDHKASRFKALVGATWDPYGRGIRYGVPDGGNLGTHLLYDVTPLMISDSTLVSATIYVDGNGAHAALPGMMPAIGLARYSASADTWESLLAAGMRDDQSASGAAFDAPHTITLTVDQNATVSVPDYTYFLVLCPEGGANGQEGTIYSNLVISSTTPRYRS